MRPGCHPASEIELLARARELAGTPIFELAARLGLSVPAELRRAKGWTGRLLELALGATAGPRDVPDFPELGVELKTLPVDIHGVPRESTFVCTIELSRIGEMEWEDSRVRRKLARVLWIPIESAPDLPVGARRVGTPWLWSPDAEEEEALRHDWEELAGAIGRGELETITGYFGRFLQVRPKARNSRSRRRGIGEDCATVAALPRGFYLRPRFTGGLLRKAFALSERHGA